MKFYVYVIEYCKNHILNVFLFQYFFKKLFFARIRKSIPLFFNRYNLSIVYKYREGKVETLYYNIF